MARYRGLALAKNRFGLDAVFVIQISESAIAAARLCVKSFMSVHPSCTCHLRYIRRKTYLSFLILYYINTFTINAAV